MTAIQIKRVYEPAENIDGLRILVDRLWPRGIKKKTAGIDLWMKEIAPSTNLRKWFNHEPEKWEKFISEYRGELQGCEAFKELIQHLKEQETMTLLYAAKDKEHNHAIILKMLLEKAYKK